MKPTDFFKKFGSWYLWGNLAAMALVVLLACLGLKYWLGVYTHHGEEIVVPDLRQKSFSDAQHILRELGLDVTVSDTGYVKTLAPDCILEQTPEAGSKVKTGRMVTVTTVRVSPDFAYAKIYVSVFPFERAEETMQALEKNNWFLRRELGRRIRNQLKVVPELQFFLDDSLEYIENIDSLLNK